jgi:hypothetical protein
MECFGTTDFDNNSGFDNISAIIISGPHYIYVRFKVVSEISTAVKVVVTAGSEGVPFLCQCISRFFLINIVITEIL